MNEFLNKLKKDLHEINMKLLHGRTIVEYLRLFCEELDKQLKIIIENRVLIDNFRVFDANTRNSTDDIYITRAQREADIGTGLLKNIDSKGKLVLSSTLEQYIKRKDDWEVIMSSANKKSKNRLDIKKLMKPFQDMDKDFPLFVPESITQAVDHLYSSKLTLDQLKQALVIWKNSYKSDIEYKKKMDIQFSEFKEEKDRSEREDLIIVKTHTGEDLNTFRQNLINDAKKRLEEEEKKVTTHKAKEMEIRAEMEPTYNDELTVTDHERDNWNRSALSQFRKERERANAYAKLWDGTKYDSRIDRGGMKNPSKMLVGGNHDIDLLKAIQNNNLEQMRIAIESGANVNVNVPTDNNMTPLILLATSIEKKPNIEMVDLLLRNGANPNLQDYNLDTALHWASARGFLEMVEKLLESENIDINITNNNLQNALHYVFDELHYLHYEIYNPDNVEPIVKLLIEKGININERDKNGTTVLHMAARENRGVVVGMLLRAGANENIKESIFNPDDTTNPLTYTAYESAEYVKNYIEEHHPSEFLFDIQDYPKPGFVNLWEKDNEGISSVLIARLHDPNFNWEKQNIPYVYEPLALNAFHEFHDERAEAAINNVYFAQEAKNEDSNLNFLPEDLEEEISKMFGGNTPGKNINLDSLYKKVEVYNSDNKKEHNILNKKIELHLKNNKKEHEKINDKINELYTKIKCLTSLTEELL